MLRMKCLVRAFNHERVEVDQRPIKPKHLLTALDHKKTRVHRRKKEFSSDQRENRSKKILSLRFRSWYFIDGMVWYGMVLYGILWYFMVWYGIIWYGIIRK